MPTKSYLSDQFLSRYTALTPPFGGDGAGEFTWLRTYSRWQETHARRESYVEHLARDVNGNVNLYQGPATHEELCREAEALFDAAFWMKVFSSGRSAWIGGTPVAELYGTAAFNCAGHVIDNLNAFVDDMHLLMVGAGVGGRCLWRDAEKLPRFRTDLEIEHEPYAPVLREARSKQTQTYSHWGLTNTIRVVVGDSKNGWVSAWQTLLSVLTSLEHSSVARVVFNYDNVRPRGERLRTFGGRASGPEALQLLFNRVAGLLSSKHNDGMRGAWYMLTPCDVNDVRCMVADAIVVGGVRRSSLMFLFSPDDLETAACKHGLYTPGHPNFGKTWRAMANISAFFEEKPTLDTLMLYADGIRTSYEPGFFNAVAARKRRPWFEVVNPCSEILLNSKGMCNLCEVNFLAFVMPHNAIDIQGLEKATRLATRLCLRQTNRTLDLPEWDVVQKRDRLLGVSLMGFEDASDLLGWGQRQRSSWHRVVRGFAHDEARKYAKEMRVPEPLLVTTIKPGGTRPLLPFVNGGANKSFAPYFIRRIRVTSTDPIAQAVRFLGYEVVPESSFMLPSAWEALNSAEREDALNRAPTLVVEFPCKSAAEKPASAESATDAFKRYLGYQRDFTDHNTSITIQVGDGEWQELMETVLENWDDYIGIAFQAKSNDAYPLMPLQEITAEEYELRKRAISRNTPLTEALSHFEFADPESDPVDGGCATGACPVR